MTLKNRLDKLEVPTVKRWREAWEQHAVFFNKHAAGLRTLDFDNVAQRLEAACPGLSAEEQQAEMDSFLDSLGITAHRAFAAWFELYDVRVPDDDPPDLSRWPHAIPMPPEEPLEDWETVKPFHDSENAIEQLGAGGYTAVLAIARAVREARAITHAKA